MADQDFNIKVVTTADTTGIKQTSADLEKLKQQQATFAETARREAAAAQAAADKGSPAVAGVTGTAIGLGTIVTVLHRAISMMREFNDEQNRWVDGMIKAQEKIRDLGESILDMQDKARDAARLGTEPLHDSFIRLQQTIIRLKTEQNLLNLPQQGEEWKKLAHDINIAEAQLKGVTHELQHQAEEAEKTAAKRAAAESKFMLDALKTSSSQTKAVLMNEEAARRALAAGDQKSAEQFQKSAEDFKKSFTPEERAEYEGLTKQRTAPIGRKAEPGESQEAVDQIERNRINFERQQKGQPPLKEGDSQGGIIGAINDLKTTFTNAWQ